jgi:Kef-type K+ transport system membrane component KefB
MPEVLGALIAGVLLGPCVFRLVDYTSDLKLLSNIGVIMLMFLAGLETDVDELKKAGRTSFVIAVMGVIIPLIFGTLGAYLFFDNFWENLFVGVILTATSVSISVETLTELGKINTRAGVNILGAAVIDDVLGLIIISVVLAVSQSFNASGSGSSVAIPLLITFAKILAFCIGSLIMVVKGPALINRFTQNAKSSRTILTFSIAAALLAAYFSELLGIAAITGAYICGLMLSQFVHKDYLTRNIKAISSGFLSLIFFASVGISAKIDSISPELIFITLLMFIIAVFGKLIGCGGAARLFKMSRKESLQIGVGMISRGEVAIITANIGLQNNIISNEIFVPTIIVVILTTIITPALLKVAFSGRKH